MENTEQRIPKNLDKANFHPIEKDIMTYLDRSTISQDRATAKEVIISFSVVTR